MPIRATMLTPRQTEVVRAILITGTVGGAARLLNVSAPGISRVMKHTEAMAGTRLFSREAGQADFASGVVRLKSADAGAIFVYLNGDEGARFLIEAKKKGLDNERMIGFFRLDHKRCGIIFNSAASRWPVSPA